MLQFLLGLDSQLAPPPSLLWLYPLSLALDQLSETPPVWLMCMCFTSKA